MVYKSIADKRDTSNGMTPAKSISRPYNPPVKPNAGPITGRNKQVQPVIRKSQGK